MSRLKSSRDSVFSVKIRNVSPKSGRLDTLSITYAKFFKYVISVSSAQDKDLVLWVLKYKIVKLAALMFSFRLISSRP